MLLMVMEIVSEGEYVTLFIYMLKLITDTLSIIVKTKNNIGM